MSEPQIPPADVIPTRTLPAFEAAIRPRVNDAPLDTPIRLGSWRPRRVGR